MRNSLIVKMDNVKHNIEVIRKNKQACLMVKGNAYGAGFGVIEKLVNLGYDYFGVSTIQEALTLRKINSEIRILIVSYVDQNELPLIVENNFEITVYNMKMLNQIDQSVKFHLKFDTGMGRLGFSEAEANAVLKTIQTKKLKPIGIYSHLACAAIEEKSETQITTFKSILKVFEPKIKFEYIHLLNTTGSIKYDTTFDNLVRIGIGMWGYVANFVEQQAYASHLKPAFSLMSVISMIKDYDGFIGYDHIEHTTGRIVTIPVGYHDGLDRRLTGYQIPNVGKIVGKVCMDQIMVQTTESLQENQSIFIFENLDIYDLVAYCQTTVYELISPLANRMERIYR
ncbi:MAG: alanine racemase [Mycoplasmatales bacterium]